MRIGHGYDVHRLVKGRRLVLGGIEVPYEQGLLGHSDADVLTHAVMDAILGAIGAGDIGRLFPPEEKAWKDADSLALLAQVVQRMEMAGFVIGNLDCTIIAQKPKLASFLPAIGERLTAALHTQRHQVNIKATTEEGLGFTGKGEGISAHAVVLLKDVPKQ